MTILVLVRGEPIEGIKHVKRILVGGRVSSLILVVAPKASWFHVFLTISDILIDVSCPVGQFVLDLLDMSRSSSTVFKSEPLRSWRVPHREWCVGTTRAGLLGADDETVARELSWEALESGDSGSVTAGEKTILGTRPIDISSAREMICQYHCTG